MYYDPVVEANGKNQQEGETVMAAEVNKEKCTGCGACVDVCPVEAIVLENGKAKVDADKCVDCGQCVEACPVEAIRIP
jgi:ferredoxin